MLDTDVLEDILDTYIDYMEDRGDCFSCVSCESLDKACKNAVKPDPDSIDFIPPKNHRLCMLEILKTLGLEDSHMYYEISNKLREDED